MRRQADSKGFTLIEMMIYMPLIGVVLAIVGGMLINALRTQSTVRSASHAIEHGAAGPRFH